MKAARTWFFICDTSPLGVARCGAPLQSIVLQNQAPTIALDGLTSHQLMGFRQVLEHAIYGFPRLKVPFPNQDRPFASGWPLRNLPKAYPCT